MTLEVPTPAVQAASTGKSIFIRSVTDQRQFEDNPRNPATPSLGFGGASQASADLKKRAIARKRGAYGKALGDILLDEGQTVEGVMRDTIKSTLRGIGYTVLDNRDQVKSDTLMMDVMIDKFWAWFTPGAFAITLRSEIETTLAINRASGGEPKHTTIKASGKKDAAASTTGAWAAVYERGLAEYREALAAQFK